MKPNRLLWLLLALVLICPSVGQAQTPQCWTWSTTTNTWEYNPACSQANPSPWNIASGKTLTILNSLTLKGIDNQSLDLTGLPQGNLKLGTASLSPAGAFQPAGASIGYSAFSSTSLTVGTGTKTLTVPTGLSFATNMLVSITYQSNAAIYMLGAVTSYNANTGQLVINSTVTVGAGTYTAWNVAISGPQGPVGATGSGADPVGSMIMWPIGPSMPTNYILADGSCISQSTYAALYAVYGTVFNTLDGCAGVTDFGIPTTPGRVPIGAGTGQTHEGGGSGTTRVLGTIGGSETHTQTGGEVGAHGHGITDPGHSHTPPAGGNFMIHGIGGTLFGYVGSYWADESTTGSSTTGISINASPAPTPMTVMNPWFVTNFIIRYQ